MTGILHAATAWILPVGIPLFLAAMCVLAPALLTGREDEARARSATGLVRAGCVACLLGHLAMAVEAARGWEQLAILGLRVTPKDHAWVLHEVAVASAAGWWALVWTVLLVGLHAGRLWRTPALPFVLEVVAILCLLALARVWELDEARSLTSETYGITMADGSEAFVPPEVHSGHLPLRHWFPAAIAPAAWILAPGGLLVAGWGLISMARDREPGGGPGGVQSRRLLAGGGLLAVAASMYWVATLLDHALFTVILLGPRAPPLAELQRSFTAEAWMPWACLFLGGIAFLFGAFHLRPRTGPEAESSERS